MSTFNKRTIQTKTILAIAVAAVVAALAAFIGSTGAQAPAGDPDAAAGQMVGYGLGFGVIIWAAVYLAALRREAKSVKWISLFVITTCGITGSVFGGSL